MGFMCQKHERFVQDGETCTHCASPEFTPPDGFDILSVATQADESAASNRRLAESVSKNNLLLKALQRKAAERRQPTPGGFYSGYDLLPRDGCAVNTPADTSRWETPAVRQANGLMLPAYPVTPDPSLREDLAKAYDRQHAKGNLMRDIEALIDAHLTKMAGE